MGLFEKLGKNKLIAKQVAKKVPKEDFLSQLKAAWAPTIGKNSNTESEVETALDRIKKSGYEDVFKTVGITREDIKQVIEEIKNEKEQPIRNEVPKIGRNEPCPCGSGKKYKYCCGG